MLPGVEVNFKLKRTLKKDLNLLKGSKHHSLLRCLLQTLALMVLKVILLSLLDFLKLFTLMEHFECLVQLLASSSLVIQTLSSGFKRLEFFRLDFEHLWEQLLTYSLQLLLHQFGSPEFLFSLK